MRNFAWKCRNMRKMPAGTFLRLLSGADSDLAELYRRADKLNLDIVAEAYNILIFTPDTSEGNYNSYEECSDWEAEVQDKIILIS